MLKQYKEAEWNKHRLERQLAEQQAAIEYSVKETNYDLDTLSHSSTHRTSKGVVALYLTFGFFLTYPQPATWFACF